MEHTLTFKHKAVAKAFVIALNKRNIEPKLDLLENNTVFKITYATEVAAHTHPDEEKEFASRDEVRRMMDDFAGFLFSEMDFQVRFMMDQVERVSTAFFDHLHRGHLPPIQGAEKFEKAMDILGISGDFEIVKPKISAAPLDHSFGGEVNIVY